MCYFQKINGSCCLYSKLGSVWFKSWCYTLQIYQGGISSAWFMSAHFGQFIAHVKYWHRSYQLVRVSSGRVFMTSRQYLLRKIKKCAHFRGRSNQAQLMFTREVSQQCVSTHPPLCKQPEAISTHLHTGKHKQTGLPTLKHKKAEWLTRKGGCPISERWRN